MVKIVIVLLLCMTLPSVSWAQQAGCGVTYSYTEGKKKGAKQQKPSSTHIDHTSTATACLELCKQHRTQYAQQGKALFGKMQYSCVYNGKTLNQTTQILH